MDPIQSGYNAVKKDLPMEDQPKEGENSNDILNKNHVNNVYMDNVPISNKPMGEMNRDVKLNILNDEYKNKLDELRRVKTKFTSEKVLDLTSGCMANTILFTIIFVCIILIVVFAIVEDCRAFIEIPCIGIIVCLILRCNFIIVSPNTAVVLTYYGRYIGTVKEPGYYFKPCCSDVFYVDLKTRFYNGSKIKVNERDGNPVLLGIVVSWKVNDTAKAIYDVANYEGFVVTQTESAIRFIGCKYPYEPTKEGELSLRGGQEVINEELRQELEKRLFQAGISVMDARITEIEYGMEVSQLMLKKQAAQSMVIAKGKMVYGAVDLIDHSLKEIDRRNMCKFSNDQKAKFVSDMMTLLCMENNATPLIKLNK